MWKIDARVAEILEMLFILIRVGVEALKDARDKLRMESERARTRVRSASILKGSGKKSKGAPILCFQLAMFLQI
jgi:hypothetical protein